MKFLSYFGAFMASRQLTLPKLLIVQQTLNRGAGCAPARRQLYWFQRLAAVLLVTVLLQSREHVCGTAYQPH